MIDCSYSTADSFKDDLINNVEETESISEDMQRHLLHESLLPSNDKAFWESFLKHVGFHDKKITEDVQDIENVSLWAVVVKVKVDKYSGLVM